MFILKVLIGSLIVYSLFAQADQGPGLGSKANPELIKQWNWDIFPDGTGLPPGSGTAITGQIVYKQKCQLCHGVEGTGDSAEELAGAHHSLTDTPPDKTIGTYWPFATTLFDFTRRSMPLNAPGTLSNSQIYAVTAYLLFLNGIIQESQVMNAKTLPKVKMPNRNGFIKIYNQSR